MKRHASLTALACGEAGTAVAVAVPAAIAITLCSLLVAQPAWAGNVVARAGQNPDFTLDNNDGALATATWGPIAGGGMAAATATRTQVVFDTLGHGASASFHLNASANHRSDYRLWDIDADQPLPSALASSLNIDFGFRLQGELAVEAISLSSGQMQWSAALVAGGAASQAGSSAIIVFGPMAGQVEGAYAYYGDASLWGSFDQTFSLQHAGASGGVLTMAASGSSANRALAQGQLSLVGLSYTPGLSGIGDLGPIGIRFVETGEILAISPVPEPQAWALWLGGAALLLALRRRQGRINPA